MASTDISTGQDQYQSADELREENEHLRSTVERFEQRLERLETVVSSNGDGSNGTGSAEHASNGTPPAEDERVDRRGALRKLGQAAAAGAGLFVAGSALSPKAAEAADGDPVTIGQSNSSDTNSRTSLDSDVDGSFVSTGSAFYVSNSGAGANGASVAVRGFAGGGSSGTYDSSLIGVAGSAPRGHGVEGASIDGVGVRGTSSSRYGVEGQGATRGVYGRSDGDGAGNWYGVYGRSSGSSGTHYGVFGVGSNEGVHGRGTGSGTGVAGYSESGGTGTFGSGEYGVEGQGVSRGVFGQSTGDGSGSWYGVRGQSSGSSGTHIGVYGSGSHRGVHGNSSTGVGVRGTSHETAIEGVGQFFSGFGFTLGPGVGVRGDGAPGLLGSAFSSSHHPLELENNGAAHMLLNPMGSSGPPDSGSHQKGEVLVDADGVLWTCTASGSPGTWTKVHTSGFSNFMHYLPSPVRALDTRDGTGGLGTGKIEGDHTVDLSGVIPDQSLALFGTLVAANPEDNGYLALWESGTWPGTANLNYRTGENISALSTTQVTDGEEFRLRARPGAPTHVILDVIAVMVPS